MNEELMKFFEAMASGLNCRGEDVGTNNVGDYTIDTCDTTDCGYETAIKKGDHNWVVVQRYPDKATAQKGHNMWMAFCAANPVEVYSVQLKDYVKL